MVGQIRDRGGGVMVAAALRYAARGWPVFPCAHKRPRTPHGFKDATTDETTIRAWWTQASNAGIAIATGVVSGLVVLDVDPRHGGDERLAALERAHGALPETVEVLTGGGGRHLYFAHPGVPVVSRVGIAAGLDVRGEGGYVIAPPSWHASGRRYAWAIGYGPDDVPLAAPPPWLRALMAAAARRLQRAGTPLVVAEGARNDTLMRLGAALRRYGIGEAAIRGALGAINREHCQPPLSAAEVATIAASVARYAPGAFPAFPPFPPGDSADVLVARALGVSA